MYTKDRVEYSENDSTKRDRPMKKKTDKTHEAVHVGILGDTSPSMKDDSCCQMFSTTRGVVKQLHEQNKDNQFTIIEFSSKCAVHARVCSDLDTILEKVPKVRTANLGGGTNLGGAFNEALIIIKNEMTDKRRKFLFVFTDGFPDDKIEAINRANDLKLANVDICCIGVGSGIDKSFIQTISPQKGYHIQEWSKLNETLAEIVSKEYEDFVRIKFTLKNRPYHIGENVKIMVTIINDSDKEIPAGTVIKFNRNSYFDSKTFKTKSGVDPESSATFEIELYPKDGATVRDICKELEYSITTPSSSIIEKGHVEFWASDFGYKVLEYRPPKSSKVSKLYIFSFGIIGSGKSSFFNRIVTLVHGLTFIQNKHTSFAITAPGGDHVTKRLEKVCFSKIFPEDETLCNLFFLLGDSFGISEKTFTEPTLFLSWLRGLLGESFEMSESIMTKQIEKCDENQVHCILFFLAQGDRGDKELIEKLKKMYQESLGYGYQPLVIVTKMDEVREQETKKQVIEQVSTLLNVNIDSIFATENYHGANMMNDEAERNFEIDKETLVILLKLFDKGDFFIKSNNMLMQKK
ncbi:predicted protein [Naegleria gruberi]|uniref:Predicted protein n=1 Tax=Naegleria gruberi TaxID=5762 RepID=D2VTT8_NAEGR|nr:uncharacterized protein NAEGRDRAFT_59200 [Naegleria gruberi]EFC39784.1 predicted protein [Naegleria gruberi]|eukprot:XP_002672528.1 predicted protein [Naegleria gruberi strain NEG-M]